MHVTKIWLVEVGVDMVAVVVMLILLVRHGAALGYVAGSGLLIATLISAMRFVAVVRSGFRPKRACVVVMGDIGRSPRMLNHALSLAQDGWEVDLVGYAESAPTERVLKHAKITIRPIKPPWKLPRNPKLLYIVLAPMAALSRTVQLAIALQSGKRPGIILVQNPPSIPTLAVTRAISWMWNGAALIVDWHNFGYTIMQTTNAPGTAVSIARLYERFVGSAADGHLCVTKCMKEYLQRMWGLKEVRVLYDRPPTSFQKASEDERHGLFQRLHNDDVLDLNDFYVRGTSSQRSDRPLLVVSSTSWTPDEDFSILLKALVRLDQQLQGYACHVVVTGKGPMKDEFEKGVREAHLNHVKVSTAWLRADDYPVLLGSADLGVCLHYSSSGLDLPMKVVDMFGCQLPVLAIRYSCIHELVQHGKNGLLFDDEVGLGDQLGQLLCNFPHDLKMITAMRENLLEFQRTRWESEWHSCAKPVVDKLGKH